MQIVSTCGFILLAAISFAPVARADAPKAPPAAKSEPAKSTQPIVDPMFTGRIVEEGDKLIAESKSTPNETLIGQLDRKQTDLALPAGDPKAKPLASEDIFDHAARCTLVFGGLYKCDKCKHTHCNAATGFVIDKSGIVVTNYHVVNSKQNMTLVAMTRGGRVLAVKEVLAADQAKDVAIVKLETGDQPLEDSLTLRPAAPRVGADVFVLSHPTNRFFSFTRGMVSRYFMAHMPQGDVSLMQITADYAKGSSGGAILDGAGQVAGMVAATTSVYYNEANGVQQNLQMVFKDCVTSDSILSLIKQPKTARADAGR